MTQDTIPDERFEHRTCAVCGSRTEAEAGELCKVGRDMTDEYYCRGGAEERSYPDGRLRFYVADRQRSRAIPSDKGGEK